jgi:DNA-binding CsgD family transcriptional regulator
MPINRRRSQHAPSPEGVDGWTGDESSLEVGRPRIAAELGLCQRCGALLADEPPLTGREKEILRLVASGLQNKEIAREIGISVATVRNHVHNILQKLGVHSKLEAISLAFRRNWVAARGEAEVLPEARNLAPPPHEARTQFFPKRFAS